MSLIPIPTIPAEVMHLVERCDSSVRFRHLIEIAIGQAVLADLWKAGFSVICDDGEERHALDPANVPQALDTIFAVDECRLHARHPDGTRGWVFLVMGNDGWDLVCDHTLNLDEALTSSSEYADKLSEWF